MKRITILRRDFLERKIDMKKGLVYSIMMKNNKSNLVKHQGYLIQTDNNNFGIYKSECGTYEVVDLKTGLLINHVNHKTIKEIKELLPKYDTILTAYKTNFATEYKIHVENYEREKEKLKCIY